MSQYEAHLRAILELPLSESSVELKNSTNNAVMLNILGGAESESHLALVGKALEDHNTRIHLYGKGDARPGRKMGHITLMTGSMEEAASRMEPLISLADLIRAERLDPQPKPTNERVKGKGAVIEPAKSQSPLVAVTMGSKSDSPVLAPGIKLLEQLGIPFDVTITSAHRTPEKMRTFAQRAADRGIKVIIAAAGIFPFMFQKKKSH